MKTHTPTMYGIPNCDTVRKARAWLSEQGIPYVFHDFKKLGVPDDALRHWLAQLGHRQLVNRRGSTWRGLDAQTQAAVVDDAAAHALLCTHPSAITRPVMDWAGDGGAVTVGFDVGIWATRIADRKNA